eukprot:TRINITY_DN10417_c4_g1_i1.p1 TRINITY_DN10417_c4_g1~~TRINITY_DN10417_c4_g1_i1.p1  ORF type:complete len:445 (+),score=106.99 TRINITY_DN10417_c4_g1_i1:133-1467(+)
MSPSLAVQNLLSDLSATGIARLECRQAIGRPSAFQLLGSNGDWHTHLDMGSKKYAPATSSMLSHAACLATNFNTHPAIASGSIGAAQPAMAAPAPPADMAAIGPGNQNDPALAGTMDAAANLQIGTDAAVQPAMAAGVPAKIPKNHPDPVLAVDIQNTEIAAQRAHLEHQLLTVEQQIQQSRQTEAASVSAEGAADAQVGDAHVLTESQEQAVHQSRDAQAMQAASVEQTAQLLANKLQILKELEKLKFVELGGVPGAVKPRRPRPLMVSAEAEQLQKPATQKVVVIHAQQPTPQPQPSIQVMLPQVNPIAQAVAPNVSLAIPTPVPTVAPNTVAMEIPIAQNPDIPRAGDYSEIPGELRLVKMSRPSAAGPLIGDVPAGHVTNLHVEDLAGDEGEIDAADEAGLPLGGPGVKQGGIGWLAAFPDPALIAKAPSRSKAIARAFL